MPHVLLVMRPSPPLPTLLQVRLAKLRGTPGLKEDKVAEAEREAAEAETKLAAAKIA
jgi:hypothetical protein